MITIPEYLNGQERGISTYAEGGCCSNYCEVSECDNCEGGNCMSSLTCTDSYEGCGTCKYTCESTSTQSCGSCESGEGCSEGCGKCQRTCQSTCEKDCQSFCEAGYQNTGIYSNNTSQQVVKMDNVKAGVNNKSVSILQAYAKTNDGIKLVYDAIDNIIGIAIVANNIFNTDSSGVRNPNQIEKYEWYGELSWTESSHRIRVNNNLASGGAGLEGKLYFKLKDGTYIDNEELINILFTYHKFVLEVYSDVSSTSRSTITVFGKNFSDAQTVIFTKDTMLNLNFSLSAWYNASYYSGFRIREASIDGRDLNIEFFDKTPELPYYANIKNVEKAIMNINHAILYSGTTYTNNYFDGTAIATDRTAYQTWINNYGTVTLSTSGSTYSSCRIQQTGGNTSSNGFALYLSGLVFLQYKDGVKKRFDDSNSLCKYFKGTSKINFYGVGGSNDWCWWSGYLNDSSNFKTTKTFDYPDDVVLGSGDEGNWFMGVCRFNVTATTYMRSYFYDLELNNIGLSATTIPTEFQIDSTLL